ncbi:hypothetical protein F7734_14770 [Scytonema sp. UIC 10036]|uniref:hypothetical protein n=1 Tax=Scytonema sp. UIC 10036 TaxID=2304196 RepID=UPI0012DA064C|nr:hypothetical protein [Scytonema sp. UIC 10036]MUG93618.1 hypothetical protein [Scytonema sp. UIC 10036]
MTLIAFIVVVLLAALIAVLKYTGGLNRALELLLRDTSLRPEDVVKIINCHKRAENLRTHWQDETSAQTLRNLS